MTIREYRTKRLSAAIPAILVAAKAKKDRSWLSQVENGHIQPSEEEITRINSALDELIAAKLAIQQTASAYGWCGRNGNLQEPKRAEKEQNVNE
jgi:transcriptional regulator with XRE-family HTH domain